jgi:TBC1 domain family member 15
MTIELDSTLAQAEVLFLSFAQLVADVDRRQVESGGGIAPSSDVRRRNGPAAERQGAGASAAASLSSNLRELLHTGQE